MNAQLIMEDVMRHVITQMDHTFVTVQKNIYWMRTSTIAQVSL